MSLLTPPNRTRGDSTIGLINIVFLMLIFFLIAGTIAPSLGGGIALMRLSDPQTQTPPDALVLRADGQLELDGMALGDDANTGAEAYLASLTDRSVARLLPDRDAPAAVMVQVANALRQGGAERVVVLGEK
ncbi:ExbD/TolR family protein [Pararhodobacter oceanensis]|uniref:ExbD/TolR family protein n=1 Tax=Pararhodobacter oceanensis TaxID=2172121 RepID=UPI003A95C6EC